MESISSKSDIPIQLSNKPARPKRLQLSRSRERKSKESKKEAVGKGSEGRGNWSKREAKVESRGECKGDLKENKDPDDVYKKYVSL